VTAPRTTSALLLLVLAALAVVYLGVYREQPGLADAWHWATSWLGGSGVRKDQAFVLADIRLPRLVVAAFGGAALALAGTVLQATFRNPLASPDLVGTTAGAAFGGAFAIVTGWSQLGVIATPAASLAGAVLVTSLVFVLARAHGRFSVTTLLLAGIALNTLVGALTSFVVTFTFNNYSASADVLFWLMGGLEDRTWEHAVITGGGCVLFALLVAPRARELDLLTLSDDTAHSLGVDAAKARRWLVWCACGLTASTVANTGGIAFVATARRSKPPR
jgi:iron complex transport system permease protein